MRAAPTPRRERCRRHVRAPVPAHRSAATRRSATPASAHGPAPPAPRGAPCGFLGRHQLDHPLEGGEGGVGPAALVQVTAEAVVQARRAKRVALLHQCARLRGDARACSTGSRRARRCCSCSRTCTGPTRRRSTSSSSSRTTSTSGECCCSRRYRADEPASAERMRRLADGVRRSGAALLVELGPLQPRRAGGAARGSTPALPAAGAGGRDRRPLGGQPVLRRGAPRRRGRREPASSRAALRDLLLQRVARLDRRTQGVLRLAAAAGRDVGYPLLRAAAALPESDVRESLRRAVEHGVLVADQATGSFRFRHALLAEAIYATLLPGEREELHARLADELARGEPPASAAELAPHWAAAGRAREALVASIEAAREAEAVFGLAEALAHLERALALWADVPDAARARRARPRRALRPGPPSWPSRRVRRRAPSSSAGRPSRSSATAIRCAPALLHERLGRYLLFARPPRRRPRRVRARGRARAAAAAVAGARAGAGGARARADADLAPRGVAGDLRAGARARPCGRRTRGRVPGAGRARSRPRLPRPRRRGPRASPAGARARRGERRSRGSGSSVRLAHRRADDAGPAAGVGPRWRRRRSRSSGATGSSTARSSPTRSRPWSRPASGTTPTASAPRRSARTPPTGRTARSSPAPSSRSAAATSTPRGRTSRPRCATVREDERGSRIYDLVVAELALWERRWTDADEAVRDGLARARLARRRPDSASSSAPRGCARRPSWRRSPAPAATPTPSAAGAAGRGSSSPPRAEPPPRPPPSRRTPPAGARWPRPSTSAPAAVARPEAWSEAAADLGAARAPAARGLLPLATGRGARRRRRVAHRRDRPAEGGARRGSAASERDPCCASSSCSPNARGSTSRRRDAGRPTRQQGLAEVLGLTPREAEVLTLVARGLTNREIAADARHQRQDRRASTSRTSCASSTRRTGSRPPRSRTASPHRSRADRA